MRINGFYNLFWVVGLLVWMGGFIPSLEAQGVEGGTTVPRPSLPPEMETLPCDDANVCTVNVRTPEGCRFDPILESELSDGNACTEDICDPKEGILHRALVINDNNVCTIDSCDPMAGVAHATIDSRINAVCSEGIGGCYAEGKWGCDPKTGEVSCTARAGEPKEEVCNESDDNCDGVLDNVARLGEVCTDGKEECLVTGRLECKPDGRLACSVVAGDGSAEKCDGIDNDCDRTTDENLAQDCYDGPADAAGVGICKKGRQDCEGGKWAACEGGVLPAAAESCDNELDDDCDGQVNEACVAEAETLPSIKTIPEASPIDDQAEAGVPAVLIASPEGKQEATPATTTKTATQADEKAEPMMVVQQPLVIKTTETMTKATAPGVKPSATATKTSEPAKQIVEPISTQTPEPTKETTLTKEPQKTPAETTSKSGEETSVQSRCRSDIFDCEKTVTVPLPLELDVAGILYPAIRQDLSLFDQQILLAAGHAKETAGLAYLEAKAFSPDGKFTFHTCSLPERWRHLEVAALEGSEKNDVVVVSQSLRYGTLSNLDQVLQSRKEKECALSPRSLGEVARRGILVDVYSLKVVPTGENESKIIGVVEVEVSGGEASGKESTTGVEYVTITPFKAPAIEEPAKEPAPGRILGLDLFSYFAGEVEFFFYEFRPLAEGENILDVRIELDPAGGGEGPLAAVAVKTDLKTEWYDCSLAGTSVSCRLNKVMAGAVPLAAAEGILITRERKFYESEGLEGAAALAYLEAFGQNLFMNGPEALRGYRIVAPEEGDDPFDFQSLENEYLTIASSDLSISNAGQPLSFMQNLFGGVDLLAFFRAGDGTRVAFFENKNEAPQMTLGPPLDEENQWLVPVLVSDEMGDPLECEATLKDPSGLDMSGCLIHADCESVGIDKACLEEEDAVGSMVAKSSLSVGESLKTLSGKVTAKDAGGGSVCKSFSVRKSGVIVAEAGETGVAVRGDTGGDLGSEGDLEAEAHAEALQPRYEASGGGCGLISADASNPASVLYFFLSLMILVSGCWVVRRQRVIKVISILLQIFPNNS